MTEEIAPEIPAEDECIDPSPDEIPADPIPYPDPMDRIKADAKGIPVVLADGREWLLADVGLIADLDELRDRVFDDYHDKKTFAIGDVRLMAVAYLQANYDLSISEIADLVISPGDDGLDERLSVAVWRNTFGSGDVEPTYTNWVLLNFFANGIDHRDIPVQMRQSLISLLVKMGRAVPKHEFIQSVIDARQWADAEIRTQAGHIPGAR